MISNVHHLETNLISSIAARTDIAVVGLSGGADSTLVAILCCAALGSENVYGVHMPYDSQDTGHGRFNARSAALAEKLKLKSMICPVNGVANEINRAVSFGMVQHGGGVLSDLNKGNARSRARMCVLYGIAHALGGSGKRVRVVGTGNLSEDYIGYDTKGGDALCDFFPIGGLFKSEVYQMLDHYKSVGVIGEEHIDRIPSAGLWAGQTDEGELGYTYNAMEPVIKKLMTLPEWELRLYQPTTDIEKFVKERHLANKHKHIGPEVIEIRHLCE